MVRAIALAMLFVGVAFAENPRVIPATIIIEGETHKATIEIKDEYLYTVVIGSEKYTLSPNDPILTRELIEQINELTSGNETYRAVPYLQGYKNALFQGIRLKVDRSTLHGYQVRNVAFQFRYAHRVFHRIEPINHDVAVTPDRVRPAFPVDQPEIYGISFGENILPVRLIGKFEQVSGDRNGNPIKEWRARVVPLQEWRGKDRLEMLTVYDVPVASLLFVEAPVIESNLARLKNEGPDAAETKGTDRYLLGMMDLVEGKDAETQVKEFVSTRTLNLASVNRSIREQEWKAIAAAKKAAESEGQQTEDIQRIDLLFEGFMELEKDERNARLEEIKSMAPIPAEEQLQLLKLLKKYENHDQKEVHDKIVEILKDCFPLPDTTVIGLSGLALAKFEESGKRALEVLKAANLSGDAEAVIVKHLLDAKTPVDSLSALRSALVNLPASGGTKHLLLNAMMSSESDNVRQIALNSLKELGPYGGEFLVEIAKNLDTKSGSEYAMELLIALDAPDSVLEEALRQIAKSGSDVGKTRAATTLARNTHFDPLQWGDEDLAAFVSRCKPPSQSP